MLTYAGVPVAAERQRLAVAFENVQRRLRLSRHLHTSAYASIRQRMLALRMCSDAFAFPDTCIRQHTSAYASIRQHTSFENVQRRLRLSRHLNTSAYVSIRQHTSAYAL